MPEIPNLIELPPDLLAILADGPGGGLTQSGGMLKLVTLVQLKCIETEDTTGADETYLSIYLNKLHETADSAVLGALQEVTAMLAFGNLLLNLPTEASPLPWGWRKDGDPTLNNGQQWEIGLTFPLLPTVGLVVRCHDEDGDFPGDAADLLGRLEVAPETPAGRHTGSFLEDDAHYELTYDVVEVTLAASPQAPAPEQFDPLQPLQKALQEVAAPVLVAAPDLLAGTAMLTWLVVPGARDYEIWRDGVALATVAGDQRTYEDRDVVAGSKYVYKMRAGSRIGWGEFSNEQLVALLPDVTVPTGPIPPIIGGSRISRGLNDAAAERVGPGVGGVR